MAAKKSFILYKSWKPLVKGLCANNPEHAAALFEAVFDYQCDGVEPDVASPIYPYFCLFKASFDEDQSNYEKQCEVNERVAQEREKRRKANEMQRCVTNRDESCSSVASRGHSAKNQQNTNETKRQATDNDNDNDINNINNIKDTDIEPPISPLGGGSGDLPVRGLADEANRTLARFNNAAAHFGGISPVLLDKARDWIAYKTSRRQPVVESSISALLAELAQKEQQHGTGAVVRAINEAIANGYSGIQWQQIGGKSAPSGRKETMFDKLKRTADELKGEMPCHDDG